MQFQIVGHACMSVEAAGTRLVTDPWIQGSVYWDSWWHWPEPVFGPELFESDFIYVTHWHFDHFHAESLDRFSRRTHILIPRFPVSSLAGHLRDLGFTQVTEITHGARFELAPGFTLTSYQSQFQDDSVAVVEADGTVLVDLNDAKPLPSTWRRLRRRHPRVDFMMRSHSPAWSYPSRFTFEDASQAIRVHRRSYADAFVAAALILRPRYAVPFASSVCHVHRNVRSENDQIVTTAEVASVWNERPRGDIALTIMPPGSGWSAARGFEIAPPGSDLPSHVARLERLEATRLEAVYREEDAHQCSFVAFRAFFEDFVKSAGWLAWWLRVHWVFRVDQEGKTEYWGVDFRRRRIARYEAEPSDCTSLMTVPAAVLDSAVRAGTFTNIDISKRWHVHIRRGGAVRHLSGMIVVALYEAGYFRLRHVLTWRCIGGLLRRVPEAIDYVILATRVVRGDSQAVADVVTDPL